MEKNELHDSATGAPTLTPEAQELLTDRFVRTLLPPLKGRHRCMANEVNYLGTTVSRVMLQTFGFRVEKTALVTMLARAGYAFFTKTGACDPHSRRVVKTGMKSLFDETEHTEEKATGEAQGGGFVYVNVDGKVARALRCLTIPTPPNMSAAKLALQAEVKARVERFRDSAPHLLAGGSVTSGAGGENSSATAD